MNANPTLAFFGASLVSSYWNGAATYYRGLLAGLANQGFDITFYEPDAYERQAHRDIDDPPWARVVVYPATTDGWQRSIERARRADTLVKASGVGVYDAELEAAVANAPASQVRIFWDVDAPATLARIDADPDDPFRAHIRAYDAIFTYGGGTPVCEAYRRHGARRVVPIYNGLDPHSHYPVPAVSGFRSDLALLANRLPDREARVAEFFWRVADRLPTRQFLLGGLGWEDVRCSNVRQLGHVRTADHNAINSSADFVLNITRDSMARCGYSPPTRVFEAAGAGACLITDAWQGIDAFFEPGRELLVAGCGDDVAVLLANTTPSQRALIGAAARRRALTDHTYDARAILAARALTGAGV